MQKEAASTKTAKKAETFSFKTSNKGLVGDDNKPNKKRTPTIPSASYLKKSELFSFLFSFQPRPRRRRRSRSAASENASTTFPFSAA